MTIEELTVKTASTTNLINDVLVEQLKLLAEQNLGVLPNEFILSDNKLSYVTFESVLELLKSLGLDVDDVRIFTPGESKNIVTTRYAEKYTVLYHVKIFV